MSDSVLLPKLTILCLCSCCSVLLSEDTKDEEDDNRRDFSSSSSRLVHKKQRKARTAFTDHQLHSMEKCFSRQKYLSVQDRMELANKLGISDTQVKTWFQNRR